ncbi:MAG: hypothetical protein JKY00_01525 [Roseicyclus sp.]|nr:hypothetical protein [Roseicyclus sp.]
MKTRTRLGPLANLTRGHIDLILIAFMLVATGAEISHAQHGATGEELQILDTGETISALCGFRAAPERAIFEIQCDTSQAFLATLAGTDISLQAVLQGRLSTAEYSGSYDDTQARQPEPMEQILSAINQCFEAVSCELPSFMGSMATTDHGSSEVEIREVELRHTVLGNPFPGGVAYLITTDEYKSIWFNLETTEWGTVFATYLLLFEE